jgi:glycosyltransferase involved in cell wall biosynthesis
MAYADTVIIGNSYLGERAYFAGVKNIAVVPTVLDPSRYHQAITKAKFRIGWIGTESTSSYLNSIAPALAMAEKQLAAEIVIIGFSQCELKGVSPTFVDWTEETEADQLAQLSVGIMPLTDSPWERGKCGYKILQYMASGIPSVASPIGVNNTIITNGTTGIQATTNAEWFEAFKFISENPKSAQLMGAAAVKRVKSNYSIEVVLPQIAQCLTNAAKNRGT